MAIGLTGLEDLTSLDSIVDLDREDSTKEDSTKEDSIKEDSTKEDSTKEDSTKEDLDSTMVDSTVDFFKEEVSVESEVSVPLCALHVLLPGLGPQGLAVVTSGALVLTNAALIPVSGTESANHLYN